MTTINLQEAKKQLDILLENALNGEEVIITEDNEPVLKLTLLRSKTPRKPGSAKGKILISQDFDSPLTDFKDYM
ncbi:MAG: type II toxin-antitoxin system Phd/YefM family antitoxin [Cyanobacterium sp. T60_A2020_053]|nr:type II toxin-antitoxin system Phd/YefM family antitoxin [Cyanobacterium sp. T60_A2020_053]